MCGREENTLHLKSSDSYDPSEWEGYDREFDPTEILDGRMNLDLDED